MSIVNTILNKVDLNTTKYTAKLKAMNRDTRKQTKGIGESFKGIGTAWAGVLSALATGALAGKIAGELTATEKAVASFIRSTGDVSDARAQFEMLQQAARDTIQPFDALQAASLNLSRNGVKPTADQLKTFSQIAYGTGQSLETVAGAFTGAMQGRYKSLQQLGVTAVDQGDKLALTYKGVTTEITKDTAALSSYFQSLGAENGEVLEYLQGGLTGALNQMENAWGDFYRALAESGLGDLMRDIVRDSADTLDDITAWINENREPIKAFFADVYDNWTLISKTVKDGFSELTSTVNSFWSSSGLAAATGTDTMIQALSQLFNFARAGFLQVMKYAEQAWIAVKGSAAAQWEGISTTVTQLSFSEGKKAYSAAMDAARAEMEETARIYDTATEMVFSDISSNVQQLKDQSLGYAEEAAAGAYRVWEKQTSDAPLAFAPTKASTASRGGGRAKSAPKAEQDGWPEYYAGVSRLARDSMSEIERLRLEHNEKLKELDAAYHASKSATEDEYNAARALIDEDYRTRYRSAQEEARDFLRQMRNDDLVELDNEYLTRLDKLRAYHEQGLIAETEYQQGLDDIRKDYEKKRTAATADQNDFFSKEELEDVNNFTSGMTSLSDAFGNLTSSMTEGSAAYKAAFAVQKAFAIASATANAIVAWSKALSAPDNVTWYQSLANYASAIAMTTGIISQLSSLTMHDTGGRIGAGQLGIVGEYGPEIVEGPAAVTSRKDTASLARSALTGDRGVTVNLYEDASKAGQVTQTDETGERVINIFVSNIRRGGEVARAMENTYQLKRYGA